MNLNLIVAYCDKNGIGCNNGIQMENTLNDLKHLKLILQQHKEKQII